MKKNFGICIMICICLCGCGAYNNTSTKNAMSTQQTKERQVDEEVSEVPDDLNISELNNEIKLYLETEYKMSNFESLDKESISIPNSTIPYKVYCLGESEQDSSAQYIVVKLELEPKQYTTEQSISFKVNVSGEISQDIIPDDLSEKSVNDGSLKPTCEGTFEVGEPYEPQFDDFDEKKQVLTDIKTAIRARYFTETPEPADEPVFYKKTKAKEIYVMDFDEGCYKYEGFYMIVYTEDGTVYLPVLWYSADDKKFYCDEMGSSEIQSYKVSDLEFAQNGELKEVKDYCERLKKCAVCKLTWESN